MALGLPYGGGGGGWGGDGDGGGLRLHGLQGVGRGGGVGEGVAGLLGERRPWRVCVSCAWEGGCAGGTRAGVCTQPG